MNQLSEEMINRLSRRIADLIPPFSITQEDLPIIFDALSSHKWLIVIKRAGRTDVFIADKPGIEL